MNRRTFLKQTFLTGLFIVSSKITSFAKITDIFSKWKIRTVEDKTPDIDIQKFHLKITGLIENKLTLEYSDLLKLIDTSYTSDFNCVEGWTVPGVKWNGISLNTLIKITKPFYSAKYINFYCYGNKYTESIPIKEIRDSYILALKINDKPLEQKHGFPLRLFYPDRYGYKSAKWIKKIVFSNQNEIGFWSKYGYPEDGIIIK